MTVELLSTADCTLCDNARQLLARLKKEFFFDFIETKLTAEDPRYNQFLASIPIMFVDGKKRFEGRMDENEVRRVLAEERRPTRVFYIGKFLEALGFLTVALGLMYGLIGNMWIDLYFFGGGCGIFAMGRYLERKEKKRKSSTEEKNVGGEKPV